MVGEWRHGGRKTSQTKEGGPWDTLLKPQGIPFSETPSPTRTNLLILLKQLYQLQTRLFTWVSLWGPFSSKNVIGVITAAVVAGLGWYEGGSPTQGSSPFILAIVHLIKSVAPGVVVGSCGLRMLRDKIVPNGCLVLLVRHMALKTSWWATLWDTFPKPCFQ